MTQSNVLLISSHQTDQTDWPRCEMRGCPDRFLSETNEDIEEHFRLVHPGARPVIG